MEWRHFEPDEVVDHFEDIWAPPSTFFARKHCVADAIRSHQFGVVVVLLSRQPFDRLSSLAVAA